MAERNNIDEQAARTRAAEVGKGKSTAASLRAKNPMSSAKGPYQILDSTWRDLERESGKKLDRNSPEDNELAFQLYTNRSRKVLEQNGIEPTPGNTYVLHVYGQKGGIDFLRKIKANPNGLAIDGMSKEVINGNRPFFYDETGKPRTNASSYNTLSSRVGGSSDPGAITLAKNLEREAMQQQAVQAQQQAQQEFAQQQAEEMAAPEEEQQVPEEEQATDPNQVQNQQDAPQEPVQETSALSRASNRAGVMYSGNRNTDANFILPTEPVQEDIKTSGESVQKMKTFAFGGVMNTVKKYNGSLFPGVKSTAENLTGTNIPQSRIPMAQPKKEYTTLKPIARRPNTIDDLYREYNSIKNPKLDSLTNNDMIRKTGQYITLHEGRSKGRKVDTSVLNAIDDAEKRHGLKRGEIASLVKREEDFKAEDSGSHYDLRDLSNYYKVNDNVSGLSPLRYLADRKVPGVKVIPTKMKLEFQREDDDKINSYLAKNPKAAKEYSRLLMKSVPNIGKKNTLDFIAQDMKKAKSRESFIKNYNPGDKNYSKMVSDDAKQLAREKEYNQYLDKRTRTRTGIAALDKSLNTRRG